MAGEVRWTREQQANTLAGISIVRDLLLGEVQFGSSDATSEAIVALEALGEPADVDGLARIVTGLANVAAMLAEHIERKTGDSAFATLSRCEQAVKAVPLITSETGAASPNRPTSR